MYVSMCVCAERTWGRSIGEKTRKERNREIVTERETERVERMLYIYICAYSVFSAPWKSTATIIRPDCCVYDNYLPAISKRKRHHHHRRRRENVVILYIIVSILLGDISFISSSTRSYIPKFDNNKSYSGVV